MKLSLNLSYIFKYHKKGIAMKIFYLMVKPPVIIQREKHKYFYRFERDLYEDTYSTSAKELETSIIPGDGL